MRRHYPGHQQRHRAATWARTAHAGVKRAREYLSGPIAKKQRMTNVDAGQTQYASRRPKSFGKKGRVPTKTLVEANRQSGLWRWQNLSPWDFATGALPINYSNSNAAAPIVRYPLYLFDLDSYPNNNQGTIYNPPVAWRLGAPTTAGSGAGSQLYFSNVETKAQNGTGAVTANQWYPENIPSGSGNASTIPNRRILQEYVQMRLMMYGTTKYATRYTVELIKLKDDWLHPDWWANTAGATAVTDPVAAANATVSLINNRTAFWQMMLAPYISNPLNTQDPYLKKQYTTVRHVCTCTIEPKLTTEPNATVPHMVRQDAFMRTNKVLKFDWDDTSLLTSAATAGEGFQVVLGDTKDTTRPKTRLYLLIRAQCVVNSSKTDGTIDPITDPSFDIFLRKKGTTLA